MKTNGLYVNQRDRFDDMPLAQIVANFNTVYGDWMADQNPLSHSRFPQDVEAEKRTSNSELALQPGRAMLQLLGMLACSGLIWRITLKP